jgi:hypothetical protein
MWMEYPAGPRGTKGGASIPRGVEIQQCCEWGRRLHLSLRALVRCWQVVRTNTY